MPIMATKTLPRRNSPLAAGVDLYQEGDAIPTPDVIEGGESAWAAWTDATRENDDAFAETQPARPPAADARYAATEPMGLSAAVDTRSGMDDASTGRRVTLEQLMVTARRNNRVCPRAPHWQRLYARLAGPHGAMHLPAPPIEPAAWANTPPLQKRLCFREQLEWAERHGMLDVVAAFLHGLDEQDWLHMGEA